MSKQCQACGRPFTPRSQNPNQNYCTNSECQREHRRRWQQQKRRDDADYRDNDARASKAWATENPEYWKRYRDENPAYAERNRNLQQQRNQNLREAGNRAVEMFGEKAAEKLPKQGKSMPNLRQHGK